MRRVSWNSRATVPVTRVTGHASHEACELKLMRFSRIVCASKSRLAWGVWVEIKIMFSTIFCKMSRLAWGVWVEIRRFYGIKSNIYRHASHEACELKYIYTYRTVSISWSRLAWGVWVEIPKVHQKCRVLRSRLAWGVWVEITVKGTKEQLIARHASHEACELKLYYFLAIFSFLPSRLAWGVWVEITKDSAVCMNIRRHASHEACELKWRKS